MLHIWTMGATYLDDIFDGSIWSPGTMSVGAKHGDTEIKGLSGALIFL